MAYNAKITTSKHGRRLGLQAMSSAEYGGSYGRQEFLVGPESLRETVSTADTTSTNVRAFGITALSGTSVASTPVYTLDPPIPGVEKVVHFLSTNSALYLKTANGEYIYGSSLGSSATCIISSGGGSVKLVGVSTAIWAVLNVSSSAVNTLRLSATT